MGLSIARYCHRAFPDYRFVPGETPHPTRDPAGHSYRSAEEHLDSFDADEWASCDPYLYGVDLFNHRFWWEAHEAWEVVWRAAGRRSLDGLFLQGLIQISVAHLKAHQGLRAPAGRLARDGLTKVSLTKGVHLGIDVSDLCTQVSDYFGGARGGPAVIRLIDL